jgi:hypothetical protein
MNIKKRYGVQRTCLQVLSVDDFFKEISNPSYGKIPIILCDLEVHTQEDYNRLIDAESKIKFEMINSKIKFSKQNER